MDVDDTSTTTTGEFPSAAATRKKRKEIAAAEARDVDAHMVVLVPDIKATIGRVLEELSTGARYIYADKRAVVTVSYYDRNPTQLIVAVCARRLLETALKAFLKSSVEPCLVTSGYSVQWQHNVMIVAW